jgi:hypothetical protein
MHLFGKLKGRRETVVIEGRTIEIMPLFDSKGTLWRDLYQKHPHHKYMIVFDDGFIGSFTKDPDQSQIEDYNIWGLTKKEAKLRKKHTHFDGENFYTPAPQKTIEDEVKELKDLVKQMMEALNELKSR